MTAVTHDGRAGEATPGQAAARSPMGPQPAPSTGAMTGGLLLALTSAASFGLSGPLARGLMDAGWSAGAAVAVRVGLAALLLAWPAVIALRGRWALLRANLPTVAGFGLVAVAGCQFAFFSAVAHLEVGVAILVEFTAPVAVVLWLWLRHGHRPGPLTVLGGLLAAAGLVLVLDLTGAVSLSLVGLAWALLAMVGAATYFVLSAQHSADGASLPPVVLAAGGLGVGAVALLVLGGVGLLPFTVATGTVTFATGPVPWWGVVAALGVVTAALSYSTGVAAARRLGARLASFVALSEVLAAVLWAWLLLGELPGPLQLVGGGLLVAGVVVVKLGET